MGQPLRRQDSTTRPSHSPCRGCGEPLQHLFVDLGTSPLANNYLSTDQLSQVEPQYPLKVYVCGRCLLVQLEEIESPQAIFRDDYAYFSSFSDSWLKHSREYVEMMLQRFAIGPVSQVIEIGSNDGYLLQYFQQRGIPVLGIEPAINAARVAEAKGIPSIPRFFSRRLAGELVASAQTADLLIVNNVLAHVPDVHDFTAGMASILNPGGIVTIEFPHFLSLIEQNQFDTIYHEHFSYFSFLSLQEIFAAEGLTCFDVEEIPTHGGSLRVFARHAEASEPPVTPRPALLLEKERRARLDHLETYRSFWSRVKSTRAQLVELLTRLREEGHQVAAYGAPAKGNTLLNYCKIGVELISWTVDRNPFKQNHYLPGSRIPVLHPDVLRLKRPDYLVILPWNLQDEIIEQLAYVREWGCRFIVPIPEPRIIP